MLERERLLILKRSDHISNYLESFARSCSLVESYYYQKAIKLLFCIMYVYRSNMSDHFNASLFLSPQTAIINAFTFSAIFPFFIDDKSMLSLGTNPRSASDSSSESKAGFPCLDSKVQLEVPYGDCELGERASAVVDFYSRHHPQRPLVIDSRH